MGAATSLPASAWSLSAPESYVLLNGPDASGAESFKLALVELVASSVLRVVEAEQPGFLARTAVTSVLTRGGSDSTPSEGPLQSVCELFQSMSGEAFPDGITGVPVARLAAAAAQRYGSLDRFVRDEVLVELERRGLYVREAYRILWLIPATRWRLTPSGQAARADLERLIALGDERFSGWVDDNRSQALAYTVLAGSALLLMSDVYPDVYRLHHDVPPGGPTGAGAEGGASFNFDPGVFDNLGTAFSTIDAGVDSGGDAGDWGGADSDGGGGDGGGGDGGGSGE